MCVCKTVLSFQVPCKVLAGIDHESHSIISHIIIIIFAYAKNRERSPVGHYLVTMRLDEKLPCGDFTKVATNSF